MTPCSWSRPKAAPPPSQRSAALAACEDRCAGHTPTPIDKNDSDLPRSLVLCRAEAKNCGAWAHKSWHRTAPTSPTFPPLSAPNASVPLGCSRRSGARLRQLPRLRYWSSLFDSERARPAPRPRGDGSVASGLVMICSHLSAPNAEVVDCSCSTGPAMLFTRRRCSAAEGRERADGLPM